MSEVRESLALAGHVQDPLARDALNSDVLTSEILLKFIKCDSLCFINYGPDSKKQFHNCLQLALKGLASRFGLNGGIEYPVFDRGDGRPGYIDVVWYGKEFSPVVLIEIDSSYREKSILKLTKNTAFLKFWIYYGGDSPKFENFPLPTDIDVIHRRRRHVLY